MDAAKCLSDLYSEVNSLIQNGQLDTPWTPLFELSRELHELLLCHHCERLITDPYVIKRAKCHHIVCKDCINSFSGCKPCSRRETRVEECKQLNLVVSGYRYLCKYIKTNAFFRDSVGRNCTEEKLLFISRVIEAANDLETLCTTSVSNGIHENTDKNTDAFQSEPSLLCEEAAKECSDQENQSFTVGEDLSDSRSNSFVTTPVTPKECVALPEAVTPQELVSEIDSSKEMETVNWLVSAESSKVTEELISSSEVINQEELESLEESDFTDELMSSDEVNCSEGLMSLNDVDSEDLVSSKESRNSNDTVLSSNEVLEMVSLKESNIPQVSSKQISVLNDIMCMESSLSSNENIVEGLISSNEGGNANQSVPLDELHTSNGNGDTMERPMSTEDLSSSTDSEAMETTVFSEELNHSKDTESNEELLSFIELNGFIDVDTKEEVVVAKESNPSSNLEAMEVFSKLNGSNDIKTEKILISTEKLNVLNSVNIVSGFKSPNGVKNILSMEELKPSKDLNACNVTETAEGCESPKNSNDSYEVTNNQSMSSEELNAFNDEKVMEGFVSSEELHDSNDFIPKGLFLSTNDLNAFIDTEAMNGFMSSKEFNNSVDSLTSAGLMSPKKLNIFNGDEFNGLFSKTSMDLAKEGMSSKTLNFISTETMQEFVSSEEIKDNTNVSDETSKELNAFNDRDILEGVLSSKESNSSIEMTKQGAVSSKDLNPFNDEGIVKDYPRELNSLNMNTSVPGCSLEESSKMFNSINDVLISNETVTAEELLSLNSSDIESGAIGEKLGASQNIFESSTDEVVYFSSGPSTSASVKRKLEDLCEKPVDDIIGNSINESFISRSSSPEIECTFSTLELKNLDHCGCNSGEKQLGQSSCHEIACPCYLNDRACGRQCSCFDCQNPIDPANAKLKKLIMQNVYSKYGFLTSDTNLRAGQQCEKTSNIKSSETVRKHNYINLKNTIEAVKLNVGKFRQKPPIINCNPSYNNPELFDFSRANIQRFLFKGYGANGERPGFVFNQSPSGKIVREPNRELWRRIDLINRKAIEQATVNPALIAYYIDLNSQPASGPSHQNVIKRV